jgi:uncharacterized PurR-regulated membrane protein YhhQ (DUF165 family)
VVAVILVSAAYIAAQMLADIMSLKIVLFAGFSMDAGTLIYPITFTLRDVVHKVSGRRGARTIILAAGVVNLVMAGLFWIASRLPYDPAAGPQPDWEVFAELTDTEVYHLWVTRFTRRFQWMRVLTSNAVSVPLDSLIFCWGAFGGMFPPAVVWSIFWANVLVKGAVTLASLPLIYVVRGEGAGEEA